MKERTPDPYVGLLKGEHRRLSEIEEKVPFVKPALDTFINSEKVLGQHTLDGDVLLWRPEGVERKRCEREKAEAGHRKKEVILMERGRQIPLPEPTHRQLPLENMGGEAASFSDLNAPTEHSSMRPDIPYTLPARLIAPFPRGRIFEADLENPAGNEGRGPAKEPTDPIE